MSATRQDNFEFKSVDEHIIHSVTPEEVQDVLVNEQKYSPFGESDRKAPDFFSELATELLKEFIESPQPFYTPIKDKMPGRPVPERNNLLGLKFQSIPGDGNCLFNSVCVHVGFTHQRLREQVANWLSQHPENYRDFVPLERGESYDDYVHSISQNGTWGGHLEIRVMMELLGQPIIVIQDSKAVNIHDLEDVNIQAGEPIFVHYNGFSHYSAYLFDSTVNIDKREILRRFVDLYETEQKIDDNQIEQKAHDEFGKEEPEGMFDKTVMRFYRDKLDSLRANLLLNSSTDHDVPIKLISINHIVRSLVHFVPALDYFGEISALAPKSSNHDSKTLEWLEGTHFFEKYSPDMNKPFFLRENLSRIKEKLIDCIPENTKGILLDIGGRFAAVLPDLLSDREIRSRLLGIIEDTENGHVQYAEVIRNASEDDLKRLNSFPIISVARSPIKAWEDYNVGLAIVHATETALRVTSDELINRNNVMVFGYGKIGRSIAHGVKNLNAEKVVVFDNDPMRLQYAQEDEFQIPSHQNQIQQYLEHIRLDPSEARSQAIFEETESFYDEAQRQQYLHESSVVFCATGSAARGPEGGMLPKEDWEILKNGVFVASCTSRDGEFNAEGLEYFENEYELTNSTSALDDKIYTYVKRSDPRRQINLVNNGNSANFLYKAAHGPEIYAVQGLILACIIELIRARGEVKALKNTMSQDEHDFFEPSLKQIARVKNCWQAVYSSATFERFLEKVEVNRQRRNDSYLSMLFRQGSKIEANLVNFSRELRDWQRKFESKILDNTSRSMENKARIDMHELQFSMLESKLAESQSISKGEFRRFHEIIIDTYIDDSSVTLFTPDRYDFDNLYMLPNLTEIALEELKESKKTAEMWSVLQGLASASTPKVSQRMPICLENLFSSSAIVQEDLVSKIILLGHPGDGKSTLSRFMAYLWAIQRLWVERFDWMFLIKLEDLVHTIEPKPSYELHEIIYHTFFKNTDFSKERAEKIINCIFRNMNDVLFILDNFDGGNAMRHPAIKTLLESSENYIITSRNYIDNKLTSRLKRVIRIESYTNNQISGYSQRYFQNHDDSEAFLKHTENSPVIMNLIRRPLFCELIHYLWCTDRNVIDQNNMSMVKIYESIVKELIGRFLIQRGVDISFYDDSNIFQEPCASRMYNFLSYISFRGIEAKKTKFSSEEMLNYTHFFTEEENNNIFTLLKSTGLLDVYVVNDAGQEKAWWEFLHVSLQEFFALEYIMRKARNQSKYDINTLRKNVKNKAFENLIVMYFEMFRGQDEKLRGLFKSVFHPRSYDKYKLNLMIECTRSSGFEEEFNQFQYSLIDLYTRDLSMGDWVFSAFLHQPCKIEMISSLLGRTIKPFSNITTNHEIRLLTKLDGVRSTKKEVVLSLFLDKQHFNFANIIMPYRKRIIAILENMLSKPRERFDFYTALSKIFGYLQYLFFMISPLVAYFLGMHEFSWWGKLGLMVSPFCLCATFFFHDFIEIHSRGEYGETSEISSFFLLALLLNSLLTSICMGLSQRFPVWVQLLYGLSEGVTLTGNMIDATKPMLNGETVIKEFLTKQTPQIFDILECIKVDFSPGTVKNAKSNLPYFFIAKLVLLANNVVVDEMDEGFQFSGDNLNQLVFFPKAGFDVAKFKKIILNDPDCSPQRSVSFHFQEEVTEEKSPDPAGHLKYD
ncbi:MAG: NACHT domain-containing protein [Gammaproteobacteria bacterium]